MNTGCGLYIHVPFCRHKCNYCDFYSTTKLGAIPHYLPALVKELDHYCQNPPAGGFTISTLYLGGGTPSLLTPGQIETIFDHVRHNGTVKPGAEITLEANPGALDDAHLAAYRKIGINRLSLGIQSFLDKELSLLDRIHTAAEAVASLVAARQAGFDNISLDLIFALPGQTLCDWKYSLMKALDLAPEHISMYGLTIEAGTPLHRDLNKGKWARCVEELEREMYLLGKETLEAAGYEHYEISNFAKPGREAHHNQQYWNGNAYIGLGPAAHSFVAGKRWWNVRDVNAYCQKIFQGGLAVAGEETITLQQLRAETILLGLRRCQGIDLNAWQKSFMESPLHNFSAAIEKMGGYDENSLPFQISASGRLLALFDDHLALTAQGILLYDFICKELYE